MLDKYHVIVKGKRTVKVTVFAKDYNDAQKKATDIAIEYFPETKIRHWEVQNTVMEKKRRY
jgi:hypothetical protein